MNFNFTQKFLTIIITILFITMGISYFIQKTLVSSLLNSEYKSRLENNLMVVENEFKSLKQQMQEDSILIKDDIQVAKAVFNKNSLEISNSISTYSSRFPNLYIRFFDIKGNLLSESFTIPPYLQTPINPSTAFSMGNDDIIFSETTEINGKLFLKTYATIRYNGENCGISLVIFPINQDFLDDLKMRLRNELILYSENNKISAVTIFDNSGNRITDKSTLKKNYISKYIYLNDYKTGVEALIPKQEISKKEFGISKKIWYVNLFFIICAAFFINSFARKAIKPFNLLINGLHNIHNGNYNEKIIHNYKDEAGKTLDTFNMMVDKLKSKQIEDEQLARIDKISSIGKMASILAHEIKNPLSAISMIISMYKNEFDTIDFEKRDFEIMEKEINRINDIIQKMLDFSKEQKLEIENKNIVKVLKNMLDFTEKKGLENNCRFHFSSNVENLFINFDEKMLNQLFLNIIMNSIDASKNGTLTVSVIQSDKQAELSFQDSGIGMNEYELKRAFEPYYTTKNNGSGIGLSVVKNILDIHCFSYLLTSKKGSGTLFKIFISLDENRALQNNFQKEKNCEL